MRRKGITAACQTDGWETDIGKRKEEGKKGIVKCTAVCATPLALQCHSIGTPVPKAWHGRANAVAKSKRQEWLGQLCLSLSERRRGVANRNYSVRPAGKQQKRGTSVRKFLFFILNRRVILQNSFFFDSCFFTGKGAQVVKFSATYFTHFVHLDAVDSR